VYSEPGEGTTFRAYFPALDSSEEEGLEEEISLVDFSGNGERILLVEDEEGVRKIAARALRDYGYIVAEAASVAEAMDVYHKEKIDFHMILSDVVLQDKTGIDIVQDLRPKEPNMKFLLSSGYADHKSHWSEVVKMGVPFLQKPYTMAGLLKKVKEVLTSEVNNNDNEHLGE
jgi:DNA-binding NtrC family response regulator